MGFPGGTSGKESACQCRGHKRHWYDLWVRKIPWRRKWQPTQVFFLGNSMNRSLAGYSPWGQSQTRLSIWAPMITNMGFPAGTSGKEPTCQCRRHKRSRFYPWVGRIPWEDMTIHPSVLAWRIPWMEEPAGLQGIGLQRVGHDWSDLACKQW